MILIGSTIERVFWGLFEERMEIPLLRCNMIIELYMTSRHLVCNLLDG